MIWETPEALQYFAKFGWPEWDGGPDGDALRVLKFMDGEWNLFAAQDGAIPLISDLDEFTIEAIIEKWIRKKLGFVDNNPVLHEWMLDSLKRRAKP